MNEFGNEYIIRGVGRTNSVEEIGNAVIKVVNNVPIKIEDIAEIKIGGAILKSVTVTVKQVRQLL